MPKTAEKKPGLYILLKNAKRREARVSTLAKGQQNQNRI
jgi:hypothetical protein